jgi:glucosyl-3-phosphoglycerate synthase
MNHSLGRVTVLIPALNEAHAVSHCVATSRAAGVARVLVLDGGSSDGTVEVATAAGAEAVRVAELAPGEPSAGKGDSLHRGLAMVDTPYVMFLDGDIRIPPEFIHTLARPLFADGRLFSKADFQRVDPVTRMISKGRVTEAVARPLLEEHFPELASLSEPLSGQIAAPTELLQRLEFEPDYGLEIGMLIDLSRAYGLDSVAHPDCGHLTHDSNEVEYLQHIAAGVRRAILSRLADGTAARSEAGINPD